MTPQPVKPNPIEFSQEKIERMKQLAQKLNQQFANKLANKTVEASKENVKDNVNESKNKVSVPEEENKALDWPSRKASSSEKTENGYDISPNKKTEPCTTDKYSQPGTSRSSSRSDESKRGHKKHKKKDKKHRKKGAKFEGERIKHLVNLGDYADLVGNKDEEEEASKNENQDDYVLRKLFKKSGMCNKICPITIQYLTYLNAEINIMLLYYTLIYSIIDITQAYICYKKIKI